MQPALDTVDVQHGKQTRLTRKATPQMVAMDPLKAEPVTVFFHILINRA